MYRVPASSPAQFLRRRGRSGSQIPLILGILSFVLFLTNFDSDCYGNHVSAAVSYVGTETNRPLSVSLNNTIQTLPSEKFADLTLTGKNQALTFVRQEEHTTRDENQVIFPHFDSTAEHEPAVIGVGDFSDRIEFAITPDDFDLYGGTSAAVWADGVFTQIATDPPGSSVADNRLFVIVHEAKDDVPETDKTVLGGEDSKLILTLEADKLVVSEGESVTLTMSLSKALTKSGGTQISLQGSSSGGAWDYNMSSCSSPSNPNGCDYYHEFIFAAGTTESSVNVDVIRDNVAEKEEFLIFARGRPVGIGDAGWEFYGADCDASECKVKITIRGEPLTVNLAASPNPVEEGNPVTITATLAYASANELEIPLNVTHKCGKCTAERTDYKKISSIIIPAGETENTAEIQTRTDSDHEDEIFLIALDNVPPEVQEGPQDSVFVKIKEPLPEVNFALASASKSEDAGAHNVVVNLSMAAPAGGLTLNYDVSGSAAGEDYSITDSGTASVSAGATSVTISVRINDDSKDENDETVILTLTDGPGYTAGSENVHTLTILDNDQSSAAHTVKLLSAYPPNPVNEGQSVIITAELSGRLSGDVEIPLALIEDTAEPADYGGLTESKITIPGGSTTGTVKIPITDDQKEEQKEQFTVEIDADRLPSALTVGDPGSIRITIINRLIITWSADPNPVYEGQTTTLTWTLSKPIGGGNGVVVIDPDCDPPKAGYVIIRVSNKRRGGNVDDFDFVNPGCDQYGVRHAKMNIYPDPDNPEYTLKTASIELRIKEDDIVEGEETLVWTRSDWAGGNSHNMLGLLHARCLPNQNCSYALTIKDRPTVSLSADPDSVAEGKLVTVTAAITEAQSTDVDVPIESKFLKGNDDGDYGPVPDRITIPAGKTEGTGEIPTRDDEIVEVDEKFRILIKQDEFEKAYPELKIWKRGAIPIWILDNDRPTVTLSVTRNTLYEGESADLTLTLSEAQPDPAAIPLTLTPGTAETGDYGSLREITIPAGTLSGMGTITTKEDLDADDETFTVSLGDLPPKIDEGMPSSVEITILERRNVHLSATKQVTEGEEVTVTVTLSGALPNPVAIPLTLTPRTAEKDDYGNLASITIAANALTGTGTIKTVKDADYDDETFTVSLGTLPSEVSEGTPSSVSVTITDPDTPPSVSLSANPNPVDEGGSVTVTATLSKALPDPVTIPLTLTPGTAEEGDYGNLASITIAANTQAGTGTIATVKDADYDDGTFTVSLGSLPPEVIEGTPSSVLVTIMDPDTPPSVSLSANPNPVDEGGSVTVTATLSQVLLDPVTIPLTLTPGTAEEGDYGNLASITIAANTQAGTGTIATVKDADYDHETFTVSLGSLPSEVSEGTPSSVLVTIMDPNTPPNVSLSANPNPVDEGGSVTVTATLSKALPDPVTIPLTLTPGTAEEGDYGNLASITIAADARTGTGTIVTVKDADYDNETFTVSLGSLPSEVSEGTPSSVLVTIMDPDTPPNVSLSANPNLVDEGGSVTVTVTLSKVLANPVTIPLTLTSGTAEEGDYGNLASITIAANARTGTGTIATVKDADYDDETFTVSLGSLPSTVYAGSPSSVLVTITDPDTPPVVLPDVRLSANPNPVDEGGSVTVMATLSKALPDPVTIPLTLTPGTAEEGDYGNLASITIAADALTGIGTIATVKDADYDHEAFTVSLGSLPSEVSEGTPSSVLVAIMDPDTPPSVSLSANPNPVDEGKAVTFTATISRVLPSPVTIPLTLTPGTAEEDDYGNPASITIAADARTGTGTIATVKDADYDHETFTVSLSSLPSEVSEGTPASILVTIRDIDTLPSTPPGVSLSASPNPVNEGDAVTITATLTGELSGPVVIPLTYTPGAPGPTEPTDYVPAPEIRIASGAQSGAAVVQTVPDEISEGTERLIVALGALPAAVEAGHPSDVEITILDDDSPPPVEVTLSVDPEKVEEGASVTVTATLANPLETAVEVPLIQTPYTAEPDDYTPLPYVTVAGGETQGTGQIVTIADNDTDDEQLIVSLGDLDPAVLVAGRESSHWVTILDRIPPKAVRVDLSASPRPVNEGDAVTITVELSAALPAAVTIPLTLTPGSADVQDYEAQIPRQVTIQSEETVGIYVIRATDDDIAEDDETFTVQVGKLPDGMAAGDPLAVTIIDDDAVGIQALPSVSLLEGSSKAFAFSLTSEPLDAVTVTLDWPSMTDLTIAPITRIFTPANWEQAQTVTLTAAKDDDFVHDQVEIILRATGADYTGMVQVLQVTITDNDAPGVDASAQVTVFEEGSETFAVRLATAPSGVVTMQIPGSAGDLSITPTRLTFTPETWQTPQEVTLRAAHDDDIVDDSETLRLTARGGGYAGIVHPVAVTVIDNDEAKILAPAEMTMEEGTQAPLPVSLAAQPSGTVTIGLTGHTGTQITLDRTSLTFTTTNWNTPQTVTLTAAEDDNDEVDRVDLRFTASGGGYGGITHTTRITVTDKGPLTLSIWSQQGLENAESLQLPIELSRATDQVVTVQYASSDDTAEAGLDYTASRGVVIFDPGATRGVVEIKLLDDRLPEEHETFKVTLSNATRNVIIAQGTGTGTIQDDDGRATLRVEDAQVQSEAGAVQFRVSLSHPQRRMVTAAYRTRDGTARAGEDYEATSGMVTLAPGTTEALIAVRLLKEDPDREEETFTVHLESAKHAGIEKAVGVATIQELMAAGKKVLDAYAARFVRTASMQVVDALGGRFRRAADGAMCAAAERAEMAQLWYSASSWDPSLGELLAGCRMSQSMPLSSGSFSVWGQGAFRQFNGQGEDALTLRADVTTGMLGADYRWSTGWLAGVLFAHSRGDGSFEMKKESGEIMSALTGIYPYVSYTRAGWEVWASAGAGRGNAEVLELKGDLTSRFGSLGMQGTLVSGGTTRLRYHGDILVTDAEIKEHDITAEVYRIRAGLEASTQITGGIRPYVEANVRQDGGSAETGTGLELGGGVRFANPAWHLRGEVRTQGLVMHTADGFTEWGFSGSLQVGRVTEGLMMRLRPSWGRGQGMSMYRQQTILDAVPMGMNAHRTELELGYGIPWKEGSARPLAGMTQLPQGRMYRLGGELRPRERLSLSIFGLAHGRKAALGDIGVNVQGMLRY